MLAAIHMRPVEAEEQVSRGDVAGVDRGPPGSPRGALADDLDTGLRGDALGRQLDQGVAPEAGASERNSS